MTPGNIACGSAGTPYRRIEGECHFGPALQAGYQYTADGGFTFVASAGADWATGVDDDIDASALSFVLGLGVGHTWR